MVYMCVRARAHSGAGACVWLAWHYRPALVGHDFGTRPRRSHKTPAARARARTHTHTLQATSLFLLVFVAHLLACLFFLFVGIEPAENWMLHYDPELVAGPIEDRYGCVRVLVRRLSLSQTLSLFLSPCLFLFRSLSLCLSFSHPLSPSPSLSPPASLPLSLPSVPDLSLLIALLLSLSPPSLPLSLPFFPFLSLNRLPLMISPSPTTTWISSQGPSVLDGHVPAPSPA